MTDAAADADDLPKKKGILGPLILGVVLAIVGGGGGYLAVTMGLLSGDGGGKEDAATKTKVAFVPLEPLIISMGSEAGTRHLRFRGELEVPPEKEREVAEILPRVTDVLNGYLRAVDMRDIEDPSSLLRLRAQMLRRIQIITGADAVSDLLVIEFVLQ